MGTWGTQPWENDAAADWFSELFAETRLDDFILSTLRLDATNNGDEIRAAAFVLTRLAEVHIWPLTSLDTCLTLAERRLLELLADSEHTSEAEADLRQGAEQLLHDVRTALARITRSD
jgi:hypothetical protein